MKKSILVLMLAVTFTLTLVPITIVQASKPLNCDISLTLDLGPPVVWNGVISGDIVGTLVITADPQPSFPGQTEHFLETWVITTADGTIALYQDGVWNMKTGRWRSNGMITAASDDWMYLISATMHVRGVTTLPVQQGMTGQGRVVISGDRQILP
jgi:hypothetical protein